MRQSVRACLWREHGDTTEDDEEDDGEPTAVRVLMATHFKPLLDLFNEHVAVSSEAVDGQNSLVGSREQKKRNY